jgi:methyl-accepting chemotaxis protein
MEHLNWFIGLTAAAILLQAGILFALYLTVRKTTTRMEALAGEFKTKTLPAVENAQALLVDVRPKVDQIVARVAEIAGSAQDSARMLHGQMERLDSTLTDVIDRTRLHIIRADELVGRTMDKVEETSETVHRTVLSPIRQVSGLMQGVSAGLDYFLGQRRRSRRDGMGVPQDELFI